MKKYFLIVFSILVTATSFAQGIDLGIKAGANFSTLTNIADVSSRTGFLIGAFATLKFSEKIALQGDILYSEQGAKGEKGFSDLKLDYITFPIVFKYYIVKKLNIQAGPQFGSVVNDSFNVNPDSFDISGVVGVGVDLPLNIRITGRYNFGLSDIGFTDFYGNAYITESKNSVYSITAGFSFL
ncbi:PorT family protein [bacterium]|nr:PorT family protein [bacterium]